MTAQEDNATLEALLRGAFNNPVNFDRVIVMRTAPVSKILKYILNAIDDFEGF